MVQDIPGSYCSGPGTFQFNRFRIVMARCWEFLCHQGSILRLDISTFFRFRKVDGVPVLMQTTVEEMLRPGTETINRLSRLQKN